MSIRIINADEKYISSFREALGVVAREERYILWLDAPPVEMVESFVKKNITDKTPQIFALDGEEVVGWADVFPFGREGINHRGMLGMGILPAYRGKGLGTQLLSEILKLAKKRGLEKVELEVYGSNASAIALYKKAGFFEEGSRKKARKHKGQYEDFILMGIYL